MVVGKGHGCVVKISTYDDGIMRWVNDFSNLYGLMGTNDKVVFQLFHDVHKRTGLAFPVFNAFVCFVFFTIHTDICCL